MTPRFSIIVPTTGRDTLARALQSLADQPLDPHDEVIIVGSPDRVKGYHLARIAPQHFRFLACPPGGNWGCDERRLGIAAATGTHLVFLDDDDVYLPGAFAAMRAKIAEAPDRPVMFKMINIDGRTLWRDKVVAFGNHGTPQFVTPNVPEKVGLWGTSYAGDTEFVIDTLKLYPPDALVWDETVTYECRPKAAAPSTPMGAQRGSPPKATGLKVLLVNPGTSVAPADVEAGLRYGLEAHGVRVVQYRLDARIDRSHRWLHNAWRIAKKTNPTIAKPTTADVFYQAGLGALEMALRHQVDVVLVVSAMYLHPDVIVLMKRAGLKVCVLFTESPYDLEHELTIARMVDGCWTNERSSVAAFRAVNPQSGYLPHGWHPERHRPGPHPGDDTVQAHDVVFVGSGNRERVDWLSLIDWTGIDLGLYGSWDLLPKASPLRRFVKGAQVSNGTTAALYRRATLGLNLYRVSKGWGPDAPVIDHAESLNPRAYELAACGVVHLSTYRDEVREVFGHLVPTFSTPAEASALVRSWLADAAGRAAIAQQLPACVAESSWSTRATTVIGDLSTLLSRAA